MKKTILTILINFILLYSFGQDVANVFEKQSIIIEKGVYSVSYKHDTNGETVISIKSN